jgi:hypothetical protein
VEIKHDPLSSESLKPVGVGRSRTRTWDHGECRAHMDAIC